MNESTFALLYGMNGKKVVLIMASGMTVAGRLDAEGAYMDADDRSVQVIDPDEPDKPMVVNPEHISMFRLA